MRRTLAALAAASALVVLAPAASAATFVPGSPQFVVIGNPVTGPVSAQIGNTGTGSGILQDLFQFTLGANGLGAGSLTSVAAVLGATNDTDLLSVFVNGLAANLVVDNDPLTETFSLAGVPITAGTLNTITVNYLSRGQFSYGGNITFNAGGVTPVTPVVPEPATWAMMLVGFGALGAAMRRRKGAPNAQGRIRFA